MKQDIDFITILCGEFNDTYKPLTRAEFWKLYHKYGNSIQKMIESDEEVQNLMKRSGSVAFSLDKLKQMGIRIVTFLEDEYPKRLLAILKDFAPPLFYVCGDSSLLNGKYIGYVGSRDAVTENDMSWTEKMIKKNVSDGFGVVTGGAKGVDSFAMHYALNNGGKVILYLPDNYKERLKDTTILHGVMDGSILIYSHVSPLAPRTNHSFVASAMERNKYIYAHDGLAVVVRSEHNKGGTWSGATEAIKHHWAVVYVRNDLECKGNQGLIELGGIALSEEGDVMEKNMETSLVKNPNDESAQMSIFDFID